MKFCWLTAKHSRHQQITLLLVLLTMVLMRRAFHVFSKIYALQMASCKHCQSTNMYSLMSNPLLPCNNSCYSCTSWLSNPHNMGTCDNLSSADASPVCLACMVSSTVCPILFTKVFGMFTRLSSLHVKLNCILRFDKVFGMFMTKSGNVRRMDLIITPHEEYPFCLLGWTGSKQYLRFLRQHAGNCNMYLNSHRQAHDSHAADMCLTPRKQHNVWCSTLSAKFLPRAHLQRGI